MLKHPNPHDPDPKSEGTFVVSDPYYDPDAGTTVVEVIATDDAALDPSEVLQAAYASFIGS